MIVDSMYSNESREWPGEVGILLSEYQSPPHTFQSSFQIFYLLMAWKGGGGGTTSFPELQYS